LKEQIRGSVVSKPAVGAIPADRFDKPERRLLDSGPASHQYAHPSEFRWVVMSQQRASCCHCYCYMVQDLSLNTP